MRWRRCPFCKRATSVPWFSQYPYLDRSLNSYRAFTIGAVSWLFMGAAFLFLVDARAGAVAVTLGVGGLGLALVTPWLLSAWQTSFGFWLSLAALSAVLLGATWAACWALVLLTPAVWMAVKHRDLSARLAGLEPLGRVPKSEVPKWTPCTWCGSRDAELVAPLYCISLVVVTLRFPGTFEGRCERHARVAALPAAFVSMWLGWWGLPWGPVWTVDVLSRNLQDGGATLGSDLVRELQRREASEGGVEDEALFADFAFGLVFGLVPFAFLSLYGPWSSAG
jgi:hypothetical protein